MTAIPPEASGTESTPAPEYPSPRIVDSRRLMGPNVYSGNEGVLLEVRVEATEEAPLRALCHEWERTVEYLLDELRWPGGEAQVHQDSAIERDASDTAWREARLFFEAPIDVLMTATEVSEQAWVWAERNVDAGEWQPLDDRVRDRLRDAAETERVARSHLLALRRAAMHRQHTFTFDDDTLSLGSGVGAHTWSLPDAPHPTAVDWAATGEVPIALVTGSNGKTTTTRLVAAMWRAAGKRAGWCCSDGVWVDELQVARGDYSGPAGAREVLRDRRVEAAVLETARGGMLRRGLAVHRAHGAIITNIAADHFGEHGIRSLADLARVKAVVAHAIGDDGCLVLNADDAVLRELSATLSVPLAWFSLRDDDPMVRAHVQRGGAVAVRRGGLLHLHHAGAWHELGAAIDMPLTLGDTAPHNVANLLGAALLAATVGVPVAAIRDTVHTFGALPSDNPGRLQLHVFGGATMLVDYAHNPEGLAALCRTAASIPATRRLLVLGQAGDRADDQLRALVRAAWSVTAFDHVIVKEMERMLRGRAVGELPAIFRDELSSVGMPAAAVDVAPDEIDAVRRALQWARTGDVLVCPVHVDKQAVLSLLASLRDAQWVPGDELPPRS